MTSTKCLRAGVAVLSADEYRRGVEIEVTGGRVVRIDSVPLDELLPGEARRVVTHGLINAHTHLDLGALGRAVPSADSFQGWVSALVEARAGLTGKEVDAGIDASVRSLMGSGTTAVVDIDSSGRTASRLGSHGLRAVVLKEVIDGSPAGFSSRSASEFEAAEAALSDAPGRGLPDRIKVGLSPHGTHTVGDELMGRLSELCRRHRGDHGTIPVAVHWAETPGESEWLLRGEGAFAGWLGPSPRLSGTERLDQAGLLGGAILIHGNDPQPGEPERIAEAGGLVVHCPGSHLFFGRDAFPFGLFEDAGVPVALGTDSWASNDALDMRRELRIARETLGLDARTAWRMGTEVPAKSLPWGHVTGRIEIGAAADFALFELPSDPLASHRSDSEILDALTLGEQPVTGTWVDGIPIS